MKPSQFILLVTALTSLALVGYAVYLQLSEGMLPCPLCIIQRYAFILLAIGCLIGMAGKALIRKLGCAIGLYASISGAAIALRQLYVVAHPSINCGIDPIQTAVNNLPFASWSPTLFLADGLCGATYEPLLGLSIPQWSLVWFVVFTIVLLLVLFKAKSIDHVKP